MLVFESCGAASKRLLEQGYARVDTMSVFASKAPVQWEAPPGWEIGATRSIETWADAYVRAFYGREDLATTVAPVLARLSTAKDVTLLESRLKGETAGVLAIFRTPGIGGVFCVGTVPEYRRLGVATGMLAKAIQMVEKEGSRLVLQALASEGSVDFYMRRGFEIMYSKQVLERKLK